MIDNQMHKINKCVHMYLQPYIDRLIPVLVVITYILLVGVAAEAVSDDKMSLKNFWRNASLTPFPPPPSLQRMHV